MNILKWPAIFEIDHETRRINLSQPPDGTCGSAYRKDAFQQIVDEAIDEGRFATLNGSHSEYFLIPGAQERVEVERYAAPLFGIAFRAVHCTAFVRTPNQGLLIWVARRSRSIFMFPGMLDSTSAGGIKSYRTPLESILDELMEEASLPRTLVRSRIQSVGVVTVGNCDPNTKLCRFEALYVYDLELGTNGTLEKPRIGKDGEVEEFLLMDCGEIMTRMRAGEFKPNVCLVMIDFLIRHGKITPDSEVQYVDLCTRLRRKLPMPLVPDFFDAVRSESPKPSQLLGDSDINPS
ncbi:NUDIX hydrolase domain-containing protein [Pochonia chlamydosporia 170]|uniref:NUDIX hydrolase domain-containing protein n=1 Tax=Pochonia chlamydosporia 170 TaxID=1380566 RepID=A0A179F459_METCM|nr:NUDIX hydrolase domain-containing protein [Pochonia chlamydosporia 170]OAQ60208.1 NUDIX hydrolase domain-containing protein [Pochonia chlamydosporia 170]